MQPLIATKDTPPWPARLLTAAEVAGWALVGLVAARLLWLALTPAGALGVSAGVPAGGLPHAALPSGPVLASLDPFFPAGPAAAADAVSGIDLVLLGTRVDAASGRGSAIIAAPDGQQQSIGVGDEVMPGVRLVAVEFESVTLDRGGTREQLYIDQSGSPADAEPPRQDRK